MCHIGRIIKQLYYAKRMSKSKPLFSFGLITDVQYADEDDGMNYRRTRHRYYRKALTCLQDAIEHWNTKEDTSFMLQLGDLLDGFCRRNSKRDEAIIILAESFQKYKNPIAHCWGNHEFYNFTRDELLESSLYPNIIVKTSPEMETPKNVTIQPTFFTSAEMKNDKLCCYCFTPCSGFLFVILDCYDISLMGRDTNHAKTILADNILSKMNPNEEKNDHRNAVERKYVKYNGSISKEQIKWLEDTLQLAEDCGEKVVICGHIPIHPNSTGGKICLLWNNDEILNLLRKFSCVIAYFAGHDHEGASHFFEDGIHHYTFESVLEAAPKNVGGNETAFATIDMYLDKMEIRGVGDIKTATLNF